jgi:hypothetical protein
VFFGNLAPGYLRFSKSEVFQRISLPELHVWLDAEQVLEADAPWLAWRSFEHEAAELCMEYWSAEVAISVTINVLLGTDFEDLTYLVSPR